jgi:hypothetical protein
MCAYCNPCPLPKMRSKASNERNREKEESKEF